MIITAIPGRTSARVLLDPTQPYLTTVRTNLAPNPNFQYGSVAPVLASGSANVDVAAPAGKSAALRITPKGSGTNTAGYPLGAGAGTMTRLGVQRGDTLTVSATCLLDAPQKATTLDVAARRIAVGFLRGTTQTFSEIVSAAAPNLTGSTRLLVTFTIPNDADDLNLRLMNGSGVATDIVFWDGVLIERSATAGSYFDGSSVDTALVTYDWSGTVGNSTSVQTTRSSPTISSTLKMSLFRQSSGEARVPVPGMQNVAVRPVVATDHTVPLGRDVTYAVVLSNGTTVTADPVRLDAPLPLLTHPVSGRTAPCVIQTWKDRSYETPGTLVKIPGRRSPVYVRDLETLGATSPVLLTKTRVEERDLEQLVAGGEVLLLRTLYPELPDAYLAVQSRASSRVAEFSGRSAARLHTLSAQEIGAEDMNEPGVGDTLGSISAALPYKTLGDLAALFPGGTLLDIATNDWSASSLTPVDTTAPSSGDELYPSESLFPSDDLYPGA